MSDLKAKNNKSGIEANIESAELATLGVRAGQLRTNEGSHSEPIFTTSSFVFDSAAQAAARFSGEEEGNIYSRFSNPTVSAFEERIAALEGAESAVGFASGMAAILSTFLGLLESGDHVVSSRSIFGTTNVLFEKYLKKFGVTVEFVDLSDLQCWSGAIRENTKLFFLESPSNPLSELVDIQALADIAHQRDILLVVDNCFCTPILQRPLALGADIVVHSATKYLDGQGRCIGGAVVGREELIKEVFATLRTTGATMSPFNAWVFLKGLETLSLRMYAHSQSALNIAQWLETQDAVAKVYYSGLKDHPQHELACRQQSAFGGVVSFEVKSEAGKARENAWALIDGTSMISITANLGDAKSTLTHPATTTHGRLSDEEKQRAKISESLVRLSVGLEDVEDIKKDILKGLSAIA